LNLETARACEAAVTGEGAVPATIGVVAGRLTVGLSDEEVECFGDARAPDGGAIEKVGLNNMAGVVARRAWGATTVAATMRIAALAGLRVFATGGIGGVHRGAGETFDVSADLTALGRVPLVCVCAGAKAILDLPKTVEYLETLGVPVVGYRTKEFPAFYSRESGLSVDITADSPEEVAEVAMNHWRTGGASAVLVCAPVPEAYAMPREEAERAVEQAVALAERGGVRGKALTPFLLARMRELTEGHTLNTNRALLVNNATIAARVAVRLVNLSRQG
ncbi:MAG TPA: pseudouridine-5'-phosphate glycosidase, partial [Blastocatellia bacterium]|nr:pseudouridine-5'-phosphate glycosidase [Blastocatellia bacterium]